MLINQFQFTNWTNVVNFAMKILLKMLFSAVVKMRTMCMRNYVLNLNSKHEDDEQGRSKKIIHINMDILSDSHDGLGKSCEFEVSIPNSGISCDSFNEFSLDSFYDHFGSSSCDENETEIIDTIE